MKKKYQNSHVDITYENGDFQETFKAIKRQKQAANALDVEILQIKLCNKSTICKVVQNVKGAERMIAYAQKQELISWYLDVNHSSPDTEDEISEGSAACSNSETCQGEGPPNADGSISNIDGFALASAIDTVWYLPAKNVNNFREWLAKIMAIDCKKMTFDGSKVFPILLHCDVDFGPACRMWDLSVLIGGFVQANFNDLSKQKSYQALERELDQCVDKLVPDFKELKIAKLSSRSLFACANAVKIHCLYRRMLGAACEPRLDDQSLRSLLELDMVLIHALAKAEVDGLRIDLKALRNITTLLRSRQSELNEELRWRSEMQRDYAHRRTGGTDAEKHCGESIALLDTDSMRSMLAELRDVQTTLYTFVDQIWKKTMKRDWDDRQDTEDRKDCRATAAHDSSLSKIYHRRRLTTCCLSAVEYRKTCQGAAILLIVLHSHLLEWAIALVTEDTSFAECLVGDEPWDAVSRKWMSRTGIPNCCSQFPVSEQVKIIVDALRRGDSLDVIAERLMVPPAMFKTIFNSFSSVFPCLVKKVGFKKLSVLVV
eukprot:399328-Hanusia_phi.AAC.6